MRSSISVYLSKSDFVYCRREQLSISVHLYQEHFRPVGDFFLLERVGDYLFRSAICWVVTRSRIRVEVGPVSEDLNQFQNRPYVIPAQAGIQAKTVRLDSRLRGNDGFETGSS
jgi:hypothetical protein